METRGFSKELEVFDNNFSTIQQSLGRRNVTHVFLHDVISFKTGFGETVTVTGRDGDLEKALAIARPHDLVCVSEKTHPAQIERLHDLGIGPDPNNIIRLNEMDASSRSISYTGALLKNSKKLDEICRMIPPDSRIVLNPYIVSPEIFQLARALESRLNQVVSVAAGTIDVVKYCIQKHLVRRKAQELQIPVAQGEVVELEAKGEGAIRDLRPMREAISRRLKDGGAVIIKSAVAVLASRIIQVRSTRGSVEMALNEIEQDPGNSAYMVESLYDVTISPNILFHIGSGDEPIRCVGITDQRLSSQLIHQGNVFPSKSVLLAPMLEAAQRFSQWIQSEGCYGIVGYDFCEYVDRKSGKVSFFLAEINPRINGSVYPLALIQNLNMRTARPVKSFLSAKWLKINVRSFGEMKERFGHYFFSEGKENGIIPYNTAALDKGIVDIVVVGKSPEETERLFDSVRQDFYGRPAP